MLLVVGGKKGRFGAKINVGHCVGHVDDKSGVGRGICTKRQLFWQDQHKYKLFECGGGAPSIFILDQPGIPVA